MDQTALVDLAFQVKHRLIDYLKASKLNLDESDPMVIRTDCPCCHRMAVVREALPGTPMPTWECLTCKEKGNTIDYAKNYFGMTEKLSQGFEEQVSNFLNNHPEAAPMPMITLP